MAYSFDDAGGRRAPHDAVLRDVLQPRHLPPGLDRGDQARHPLAAGRRGEAGVRRRRLGALRHRTDWTQAPRPVAGAAREARRAAAAVPDRGDQVQRAAARRPRRRAAHPRARRAADARAGRPPAALRRHGPPLRELDRQHQEQVARRHGRGRGARGRRAGRDHRPGRQHRRLEPLPEGRQAALLLQPARHPALLRRRRQRGARGHPPGAHGVRLRRAGAGQGRRRRRSTSTGSSAARGRSRRRPR